MQGEELEPPKMLSDAWSYHSNQIAGLVGKSYTIGTLAKYRSGLRALKKFLKLRLGTDDIRLDEINFRFVKDYDYYLKADYGVKNNTAVQIIKKLRTIMKIAYEIGWVRTDPFLSYRAKIDEVFREFLTTEELNALAFKKFSKQRLNMVRDLFLFSCYTGLSYSDAANLKYSDLLKGEDGGMWLQTNRIKNNNRVRLPLLAPAIKIIDFYKDFPRLLNEEYVLPRISNQRANSYLKDIAKGMKWIKYLTFHCARHTFATTVTLTNGVPIETVGQMLGHKNIRSTQIYARVTDTKITKDMKRLRNRLTRETIRMTSEEP